MPTERFYRLPQEKRTIIRDAAIREFTRVPFEKASINQIIQSADISRGSFYTYFEDKRDILSFVFEDIKRGTREFCKQQMIRNNGDFWDMMEQLLEYMIELCAHSHIFELSKNLMMSPEMFDFFEAECAPQDHMREHIKEAVWIYDYVDWTDFRSRNKEDFFALFSLSMAALIMSLTHYHRGKYDLVGARAELASRLRLIQYGACEPIDKKTELGDKCNEKK